MHAAMKQTLSQSQSAAFPDPVLAMAYVLMQPWEQTYDLQTALCRGTLFPSLDKPFLGKEVTPRG